jgi:hypothetical protein
MPNFAGAISAMNGVVGKAVELAGEYKGLLKNEGGLGRASKKAVNEIGDKSTQRISQQAKSIANNTKDYNKLVGASNIKAKNIANELGGSGGSKLHGDFNNARLKRYAASSLESGNINQGSFNKALFKTQAEAGARTVKNATQEYFLDPLKAFKNSTGEAKSLAGKQAAARIGTAAVGLGAAGAVATNEL